MTIFQIIFLVGYFSANTMIAFSYFDKDEKHAFLQFTGLYFFGLPYFIFIGSKTLFGLFWSDFFQIPFFYKFYFTDKFKVVDSKLIPDLEKWRSKRGNSFKDRIFKKACDLLIKRAKHK